MSVSPPKEDVEHGGQSPENSEQMDRGDPEAQARELAYEFEVKEQDRWLPIANGWHNSLASDANIRNFAPVARIMKTALPENAKIAKEAKECMQECVSEFISFITSEGKKPPNPSADPRSNPGNELLASEKCQQEKRKTVNGEDILFAMTSLGFENYAEALKIYLSKYRETQSARGENQQRPGSGYGSAAAQPGPSTSNVGSGPNPPSASTTYQQQGEGVNSILGSGLESGEQESSPYGHVYPPGSGNNGVGGESY
ncbi:MAG: hypothetical protein Q9190_002734 [Brigantiaea leucoxantha]